MKSTIRLFKAVPIAKVGKKKASKELLKTTIPLGFIFSPEVIFNYSDNELGQLIKEIISEFGLTGEQMNSSFHKSWKKIKDTDMMELILEQIIHYITTYGYERLGIYDKDSVYIPAEELRIPKLKENIPLIVIRGCTKAELKEKILNLLQSGIALGEDTKQDVIDIITFVEIEEGEIASIKNKEVRVVLYDYLDMFPQTPVEFLRFAIYKSTNKTLLIKDRITITEIKSKDNLVILKLFKNYGAKYGLEKLAEIFLRFKPLFLAFRTNKGLKRIINKIRKLAIKHHKPMKEDYLNNITALIKKNEEISKVTLEKELSKVNIFRKVRLLYALQYRLHNIDKENKI